MSNTLEYIFYRDPLSGINAELNSEHNLFGRWLIDEIGDDEQKISTIDALILQARQPLSETLIYSGRELSLYLNYDEALVRLHVFSDDTDEEQLLEDSLHVDENLTFSGCGFDDFIAFFKSWKAFLQE